MVRPTRLRPGVVFIGDRRTSMRLEPELWRILEAIASQRNVTVDQLVTDIDAKTDGPRTSAVRVFIVDFLARLAGFPVHASQPEGAAANAK